LGARGDESTTTLPWLSLLLVVACIAATLHGPTPTQGAVAPLERACGVEAGSPGLCADSPTLLSLLSYALFHSSGTGLAVSALLLPLLGFRLEPLLGRAAFGLVVVLAACGAAMLHVSFAPPGAPPLIGTSGVLAGLLAVYAPARGRRFDGATDSPVLVAVGLGLLAPAVLGVDGSFGLGSPTGSMAGPWQLAVVCAGGAVGGVAGLWMARSLGLAGRRRGAAVPGPRESSRASRASSGEPSLAAVREDVRAGRHGAAIDAWLRLAGPEPPTDAEPALLIRMAMLLREAGRPREAVSALQAALARSGRSGPAVAARVARAARELDPATAETAAWQALGSTELTLDERQSLEGVLSEVVEPLSWTPCTGRRAASIEIDLRERSLEALSALPVQIEPDQVVLRLEGTNERGLAYARIEAVSIAAVGGLGPRPVLVVDLVLNWTETVEHPLRVVRMRADRFDPRRLLPGAETAADALRSMIELLIDRAGAVALPDREAALGRPFAVFDDIDVYQRTVLMVVGAAADEDKPDG
jgi:membrane associated rhomboid family serine protease